MIFLKRHLKGMEFILPCYKPDRLQIGTSPTYSLMFFPNCKEYQDTKGIVSTTAIL